MANTDRARKLLVRTALVTSTTIATLVGAQNFAMLDARDFPIDLTPSSEPNEVVVVTPSATRTPVQIERAAPDITILQAAPSITILRQSGQINTSQPTAANVTSIQPPAPSQITAPNPVVVQQPVPQRSQSSR
jgi:hypothetical protein